MAGLVRCRGICLSLLLYAAALSSAAYAGSIFDDDWTPPSPRKIVAPPQDLPPTKATPTTHPGTAAESSVPKPTSPSVADAAPSRRPIPEKAAQAKSRKLFKEVFVKELA